MLRILELNGCSLFRNNTDLSVWNFEIHVDSTLFTSGQHSALSKSSFSFDTATMESNENEEKKPLSFGFAKRQETKQLKTSAVGVYEDREKVENDKDFVVSVERNRVKSTKPTQKTSKEYVIPLIKQNRWRANSSDVSRSDKSDLDLIAAQEILEDSAKLNGEWEERGDVETGTSKPIPLLMQNKVPDGFETDSSLNVQLRPEEPKDADYDQIPIEHFGMALLRGMGWKEGMGVGKNAKVVAPLEAQLRPKGLGLGADKSNESKKDNTSASDIILKSNEMEENLELKSGSYCVVLSGQNKDLYGRIEGVDEDNARVMVRLSVSGKVVNLIQCAIQLVSKENFEKHSKYLNKQKVDKFKENQLSKEEKERSSKDKSRRNKTDDHYEDFQNGSDSKEAKKRKGLHHYSRDEYEGKQSNKKHKHKYHKHHKNKSSHNYTEYNSDSEEVLPNNSNKHPWIKKDLRVRVIDKNLKGGKYYKEKVIVEDVPSPNFCVCKTSDGRVIENVSQSSLETVVPRGDGAIVTIITGSYHGQLGHIMKRDKEKCLALVQLLTDRDMVLKLHYDEICEYVGDVHFVE